MIFKKKKEKGGKEKNEKNNINLSNVTEDGTKLVLIIDVCVYSVCVWVYIDLTY